MQLLKQPWACPYTLLHHTTAWCHPTSGPARPVGKAQVASRSRQLSMFIRGVSNYRAGKASHQPFCSYMHAHPPPFSAAYESGQARSKGRACSWKCSMKDSSAWARTPSAAVSPQGGVMGPSQWGCLWPATHAAGCSILQSPLEMQVWCLRLPKGAISSTARPMTPFEKCHLHFEPLLFFLSKPRSFSLSALSVRNFF